MNEYLVNAIRRRSELDTDAIAERINDHLYRPLTLSRESSLEVLDSLENPSPPTEALIAMFREKGEQS